MKLYVHELKNNIANCKIAADGMDNELFKLKNKDFNSDLFWYHCQTFILYSANISKLLWTSYRPKQKVNYQKERAELRTELKIKEDNILRNKRVRNAFEHIDEKMENHQFNIHMDKVFGELYKYMSYGDKTEDEIKKNIFRLYVPHKKELLFYGESINISEMYAEILEIQERICEWENAQDLQDIEY